MVNTWKNSYFQTDGIRVLFVLPQSWTDAFIPMDIQPQPRKVVRVMVGRLEMLSAEPRASRRSRDREAWLPTTRARPGRHSASCASRGGTSSRSYAGWPKTTERRAGASALPPAAPDRLRDRPPRGRPQRGRRQADRTPTRSCSRPPGQAAARGRSRLRRQVRGKCGSGGSRDLSARSQPEDRGFAFRHRDQSRRRSRLSATTARLPSSMLLGSNSSLGR